MFSLLQKQNRPCLMKNEPTDLEKFQALQIVALQKALEEAENDIVSLHLKFNNGARQSKGYLERIQEHRNNPIFQNPIVETDYSTDKKL